MTQTLAFVGAVGGAGTTRLAVEAAATLARDGKDAAIVDAAFATQGLADYVDGRIDPDVTALVTDDAVELGDTLVSLETDTEGHLSVCPAYAPFERLARAKTAGAAERFEKQIAAAALSHDVVIVDTPPVAANQAVAAVNVTDQTVVVAPDTQRGADAFARLRARLTDLDQTVDSVLANFADQTPVVTEADARIPSCEITAPGGAPACLDPESEFAPAVADAVETVSDVTLELEFDHSGRLSGLLGE